MPSKEYWERRQVMDAYKVFQDAEKVSDEIAKLYKKSSSYISKKIEGIFERFKVKWGLSDQEAWNLIAPMRSSAELDDLLQKLQNTTQTDRIRELRAQIESSAYRARIERLAELVDQMDAVMHRVYRQELKQSSDFYRGLARDAYYRSIFNLQQGANASFSFAHIDHKAIDKVLSMNWSGQHYSKRIWNNTKDLAQTVKQELMVSLITGKTEREAANVIATRFAQGASRARRLVRTESNHVSTELNSMAYEEAGVEEYLYLATLDLRTSEICRSLDGKIFKLAERKVGTNCPPMHPWCRSTTIAVIDKELLKNLTRRARDPETGKTYTVPLTMNYEQWYKKYVEGKPVAAGGRIKKSINQNVPGGRNSRNTGTEVQYNENASFFIPHDEWTQDVREAVSNAMRDVAKKGGSDGNEHLRLVDLKTGDWSYYETNGEAREVGYDFWKYLDEHKNSRFAFIHNHNTDSSFSETDMSTLLTAEQIPVMIAVRNDGVVYLAERKGDVLRSGFFDDLYPDDIKRLNQKVRDGIISVAKRSRSRETMIVDNLLRDYTKAGELIEYDTRE